MVLNTHVAIVILNWNGKVFLEQFLPSVIKYSNGATIYVADNLSTDESNLFLEAHYPQVQIIKNKDKDCLSNKCRLKADKIKLKG